LEAYFVENDTVRLKHIVPMIPVKRRQPLTEGRQVLFRFGRHAEAYANQMVSEGATCRVKPHNFGSAVMVEEAPYEADDPPVWSSEHTRRVGADQPHGVGAKRAGRQWKPPRTKRPEDQAHGPGARRKPADSSGAGIYGPGGSMEEAY